MEFDCIVWDFDGVLNRNVVDGRLLWADAFEEDIGQSLDTFVKSVFNEAFPEIIRGRIDLLDHVANWAQRVGYAPGASDLLDYWFAKDALPDTRMAKIMDRVAARGLRHVIATNNEPRRTSFIEHEMNFGQRVEHIFSSGRMVYAKSENAFFTSVRERLGVAAERLILIDDSATNVAAAKTHGWQAVLFKELDYAGLEARLGLD